MSSKIGYAVAIFVGAFLLFQVEPLIAKIILPWFGGVAGVWIVCLLFFQFVLLLGYAYAHWLTTKFAPATQSRIHAALLVASLLTLPVAFPTFWSRNFWKPNGPQSPSWHILLLLTATIGLSYFLLSSTSPLLQSWYARRFSESGDATPYRFYSLSNVGSMFALLSYPVVVEPFIATRHQAFVWAVVYAVFAVGCAAIAFGASGKELAKDATELRTGEWLRPQGVARGAANWGKRVLWVGLAGCGSALLLSVTNHISQNVASVPFLWILPLSLYLLSFILCFASQHLYPRGFFLRLLGIALGGMTYALSPSFSGLPPKVSLPMFCGGLFVACMFCHGELARLKPETRQLTSFYLMISLGGALGALFVAIVAPAIFTGFYELHVALGACAILVVMVYGLDRESPFSLRRKANRARSEPTPGGRTVRPMPKAGELPSGVEAGGLVLTGLALAVIWGLVYNAHEDAEHALFAARNFYGVVRVVDRPLTPVANDANGNSSAGDSEDMTRSLMNGTINHGMQFLAPDRQKTATTYYSKRSGIGMALQLLGNASSGKPLRVGIIGLGAGTTAVYGRAGDRFTYYEINPLVIQVAQQQFTFLKGSEATITIVQGDARLSLESETPQNFDLLAVDAFTGDSIPVHLLTREAFQLYFTHLKPQGVLAVHISNQFLNLQPVVAAEAANLGKKAVLIHNSDDHAEGVYAANWVLLSDPNGFTAREDVDMAGPVILPGTKSRIWTDDFSNLFEALK